VIDTGNLNVSYRIFFIVYRHIWWIKYYYYFILHEFLSHLPLCKWVSMSNRSTAVSAVFRLQERRQKRIVYAAFGGSVLASLVWLIALCTDGWIEIVLPEPGVYLPSFDDDNALGQSVLVEKMWAGFWHLCRVEHHNVTAGITSSTDAERRDTLEGTYKSRQTNTMFRWMKTIVLFPSFDSSTIYIFWFRPSTTCA